MLKIHFLKSIPLEVLERVARGEAESARERLQVRIGRNGLGNAVDLDPADLEGLHQVVAIVPESLFEAEPGHLSVSVAERVFRHFQGEIWSPNGEARALIRALGLDHTSMSVGDMIECSITGERLLCDVFGFRHVGGAAALEGVDA